MSEEIFTSESNEVSNMLQGEISNIYSKLSIQENFDFDSKEEMNFVEQCIVECFDTKFKKIDTKELQENDELINNSFVELLKICLLKKFKKPGIIFICFVDYFNLDYNKTFVSLHEKLQNLIKNSCKCLIGKKCYVKYVNKTIVTQPIITLFNLVENKNLKII
jgi:hypothetical protein